MWRLRATSGEGWLRHHDGTGPIVSAAKGTAEALQFNDEGQARRLAARVNGDPDRVPLVVVEGEATSPYEHGAPT